LDTQWRQLEAVSILQAAAIDGLQLRIISMALFGRTDSAASAMIETTGS